jgi:hypothetical protein
MHVFKQEDWHPSIEAPDGSQGASAASRKLKTSLFQGSEFDEYR